MNKILNALDFLKGYKTIISSWFTVGGILSTVIFKVDLSQADLMELFNTLLDQSYIICGAIGIMYGVIMKIVRKFRK